MIVGSPPRIESRKGGGNKQMKRDLVKGKRSLIQMSLGVMVVLLFLFYGCQKKICPFSNAASSPEEIAQRMLSALEKSDTTAMWALRVSKAEFDSILWPPYGNKYNQPPGFAWSLNSLDSKKAIERALDELGGQKLKLVKVYFGMGKDIHKGIKAPFTIWRDFRVVAQNEKGEEVEIRYINTVIEMNGGYKVAAFHS
jgi:hypothetical protein